jgi:hypothetical protein
MQCNLLKIFINLYFILVVLIKFLKHVLCILQIILIKYCQKVKIVFISFQIAIIFCWIKHLFYYICLIISIKFSIFLIGLVNIHKLINRSQVSLFVDRCENVSEHGFLS